MPELPEGTRRYEVGVFTDVGEPTKYTICASSSTDAQVLAFALDGGFSGGLRDLDAGYIQLALQSTEIL
jgi:hypothetical protein